MVLKYRKPGENQLTNNDITKVNYITSMVLELVLSITIYVNAFKYKRLYVEIFSEINACWIELSNASSIILGKLRVQVNCIVFVFLLLIVIVNSAVTYTQQVSAIRKILFAVTFVLPAVLQYATVAFFLVMIMMIVALIRNVEEHLALLTHTRRISYVDDACGEMVSRPALTSLSHLRRLYARILGAKRRINTVFQAPLLLILAESMHKLVIVIHMLYHILVFQPDYYNHNIRELTCWMFYQIVKIFTIGHAAALLRKQVINRKLY